VRWLLACGHLDSDPTLRMVRVREPRRVPRALSPGDVARLLDACESPRERFVIRIMVTLGLRRIEVARLHTADIDWDRRLLHVRGKADNERVLPLVDDAVDALRDYLAWRGDHPGPVLEQFNGRSRPTGASLSAPYIGDIASRVFDRAGVKRGPWDGNSGHALRHTAASDVLDRCGNVRTVQAMLGHVSLQSTQIYLRRASLDQLRDAMSGRTYGGQP
jgi:integrase/recombinase XerD